MSWLAWLGDWAGDFGREFAVHAFENAHELGGMTPRDWLLAYLDGIGEADLKVAVRQGITLWDLMAADENLRRIITTDGWWTGIVHSLPPDEAAEMVYTSLVAKDARYKKLITREWLSESFQAFLEALHQ